MRILTDACAVACIDAPDRQSVADHLVTRAYVMPDLSTFIANADLMFDDQSQRSKALWQYLVFKLAKTTKLDLKSAMQETNANFVELGPLLELIGERQNDSYVLR